MISLRNKLNLEGYGLLLQNNELTITKTLENEYIVIEDDLNVIVEENATVGEDPTEIAADDFGITVIGSGVTVGRGATVGAKEMITEDVKEEA